jgi:hypothetical protein
MITCYFPYVGVQHTLELYYVWFSIIYLFNIFSGSEEEFDLTMNEEQENIVDIACVARGLYPIPDVKIEYNK